MEDDCCSLGLLLHIDDDDERWMYQRSEMAGMLDIDDDDYGEA